MADYGNVSREDATKNALFIQEVTGIKDIPIVGVAVRSLVGEEPIFYPEIHGNFGLGPITPNTQDPDGLFENFEKLRESSKNMIFTVVNVGRLTSLAIAFVLYPSVMDKVPAYYIMGGAFQYPGNVTPVAEANIYSDPYASNLVMTLAKNVTIFPLNITNYANIPQEVLEYLIYIIRAKKIK